MKVASWNVNGFRSVLNKGFGNWLESEKPDIVCLQEIKCREDQVGHIFSRSHGDSIWRDYRFVWHSAEKAGYSGVLTLVRSSDFQAQLGLGCEQIDREGRWLEIDFGNFLIINSYFPNSQRDHQRLSYKLDFCKKALYRMQYLREKRSKMVILCGDLNIAHKEIDLKNPKANQNNAGFLPEERSWLDEVTRSGWIDGFRAFESNGGHYTWWSYRPGIRERNIGWRLDYFIVSEGHRNQLKSVFHQPNVKGSDHCPLILRVF